MSDLFWLHKAVKLKDLRDYEHNPRTISKKALLKAGYSPEDEVDILYPSRPLTPTEFQRLNIRDNLAFGAFDFDALANHFNVIELMEWGLEPESMHIDNQTLKEEEDTSKETCELCGKIL